MVLERPSYLRSTASGCLLEVLYSLFKLKLRNGMNLLI